MEENLSEKNIEVVNVAPTAHVLSFQESEREPRMLGFAKDLIGDFDLEAFNSITPEDMGFKE